MVKYPLYHDNLNPKIWKGNNIKLSLRTHLISIAKDFIAQSEIKAKVLDIVLTGSNANYNWTQYSDLDLHIILDFNTINKDVELVKRAVDGIRSDFNHKHHISANGYNVELYIQDINEKHVSSGVYSLLHNKWISEPKPDYVKLDKKHLLQKYEDYKFSIIKYIEEAKKTKNYKELYTKGKTLMKDIIRMRKSGLEEEGELSLENYTFKILRSLGWIEKLIDSTNITYDKAFTK